MIFYRLFDRGQLFGKTLALFYQDLVLSIDRYLLVVVLKMLVFGLRQPKQKKNTSITFHHSTAEPPMNDTTTKIM